MILWRLSWRILHWHMGKKTSHSMKYQLPNITKKGWIYVMGIWRKDFTGGWMVLLVWLVSIRMNTWWLWIYPISLSSHGDSDPYKATSDKEEFVTMSRVERYRLVLFVYLLLSIIKKNWGGINLWLKWDTCEWEWYDGFRWSGGYGGWCW